MRTIRVFPGTALLVGMLVAPAPARAQWEMQLEPGKIEVPRGTMAIRNLDSVWTATGQVLEHVSIVIRDGIIEAIGPDVSVPRGAEVIDGSGLTAMPGLVDEHSHTAMDRSTNEWTTPVSAEVRVADALDPGSFTIYQALSGGVTTALILHGSANPIGGQSAVIKMRWGMSTPEQLLFAGAPRIIKFALGENVTRKNSRSRGRARFPRSRAGVESFYVQAFTAAQEYRRAWQEYRRNPSAHPVPPRRDLRLETLVDVMEGKIRVHTHSYRSDEIVMLIEVAERFGFKIDVFTHVLEGYKVADEIAAHGAGASTFSDWWAYKLEVYDAIPYNAAILHDHGVLTSLNSDLPYLQPFLVQEFSKPVKYGGVSREEALRMLTINPARQLRIDDKVGTLEVGKQADIVLLDGDPFDTYTRVEKTIVDGVVYYDLARDAELRGDPVRPLPEVHPTAVAGAPGAAGGTAAGGSVGGTPRSSATSAVPTEADMALVGATVHPVSGPVIDDGLVLIENGRITWVGPHSGTPLPQGATVVDLDGKHLYPGMIDPMTQIGMIEVGQVAVSRDDREVGRYNPHVDALWDLNPHSVEIPVARANGLTSVLSVPASGVIQGAGVVIHLTGDTPERMMVEDRAAIVVNFPAAKGDWWDEPKLEGERLEELVDLFHRAVEYAAAPATNDDPTAPFDANDWLRSRAVLEGLAPAVRGDEPVFFRVQRERDIRTLLLFLDEFPEVRAVIVGGDQAYRVADELAQRGIGVIVGSELSPPLDRDDPISAGWENARMLAAAGVKFAFSTQDYAQVRDLPYHAARAVSFGLDPAAGLRAVTLSAAELLGIGDETGSIDVGKRADLIVTDGDPLQILTHVERMFIDGREVSLESKHTRLWRQFRDRH